MYIEIVEKGFPQTRRVENELQRDKGIPPCRVSRYQIYDADVVLVSCDMRKVGVPCTLPSLKSCRVLHHIRYEGNAPGSFRNCE